MRRCTNSPLIALVLVGAAACQEDDVTPDFERHAPAEQAAGPAAPLGAIVVDPRVVDYGEALRTASLKLVGDIPKLADVLALRDAKDQKAFYEARIDALLADPRFATTQIAWWQSTFKTGAAGSPDASGSDLDAAATFAASIVVSRRPYTDLFTAAGGTCATFEGGRFVPHDCPGDIPSVGVLTDPGLLSQYFGNLAFRRVRFVQETFACSPFPAEFAAQPSVVDTGVYTSPWPFDSISGHRTSATASIDFQATSGRVCANCHSTLNHVAPLFAMFDKEGRPSDTFAVPKPGAAKTTREDWLPAGQPLAWRSGTNVDDMRALGAALAKDQDVARCAAKRVYAFAWSRGDIVDDHANVSDDMVAKLTDDFVQGGFDLASVIRSVFVSEDFVRF